VSTGIRRLNHAVLFVSDLDRALEFYSEVLGFTVMTTVERMNAAFLTTPDSRNDHDLGLFALGVGSPGPVQGQTGLYHLAWQVDTIDQLAALRAAVSDAGAFGGESSHGTTKSIYGADPDGNQFEIMWMLPRAAWDEVPERAVVEHLDLGAELARWSGVGTADELGPGR